MIKKLKHIIVFILIVFILFLIVFISLAASKPVSINILTVGTQNVMELKYGRWSGLGMGISSGITPLVFDSYVDTLLANGFTELRLSMSSYNDVGRLAESKAEVIRAVAKGINVIWGVGHGMTTITADNWAEYRQAVLDNALWAQNNGVYEFQLGNEEEYHIDGTTMTIAQLIINLKSVATDAQAIFTRGNISYSVGPLGIDGNEWVTAGKGDIDILGANIYQEVGDPYWKTRITNLVNAFGADGVYLTEFNLHAWSLDTYSPDETIQAVALNSMIEYIKASGIKRAMYFCWNSWAGDGAYGDFGVIKVDGTYRQLRDVLTSTMTKTVSTTTTTATTT